MFDIISLVLVGVLGVLIVFGRRATKSQMAQIEGQPGAAVAVLSLLKRGWKTDQVIAFNKQQDVVHRLVGPPGIVLIGEGNPNRLKSLMASERVSTSEWPPRRRSTGGDRLRRGGASGKLPRHVTKMKRQVAGTDHRPARPAARARRVAAQHPAAEGTCADQHEGPAGQPARTLQRAVTGAGTEESR